MSTTIEGKALGLRYVKQSFWKNAITNYPGVISIAVFVIVIAGIFSVVTDNFLTVHNLLSILRQAAPLCIVAAAMTFVITTAGIDLSVGSVGAVAGVLAATAMYSWGLPSVPAIALAIAVGACIGLVHGYLVAFQGIPPFIVTLTSLFIYRGVALLITEGYSIPIPADSLLAFLGRGWIFGIPTPVVLACVTLVVAYITFNHTRYGRYVTGVGSNAEGVRRSGVSIRKIRTLVYVWSGAAAAVAGLIFTARLGSGSANQGVMFELDVIAAVVLGSTSLFGGRGSIIGTIFGALAISMILNGLILAHVSPYYTQIATGLIIVLAIWFNTWLLGRPVRRPS
ncbi:ABC transporter permease [Pseudochelatococcus sp. B33]